MRKGTNLAFLVLVVTLSLVALSSSAAWGQRATAGDPAGWADCVDVLPDIYVGDFDGNEKFDLGLFWPDNNSFEVLLSDGKRFGVSGSGYWVAPNAFGNRDGKYYIGDFNGDRRSDLGYFNPGDNTFHVSTSTGKRFAGPNSGQWIAPNTFGHRDGQYYVGYFNGGLKADLGFFEPADNSFYVTLSTGSGFGADHSGRWIAPGEFGNAAGRYLIGDFNEDGSEDLGFYEPSNNSINISLSDGTDFQKPGSGRWLIGFGNPGGQYYVGDYNGSGTADLGFFEPSNNTFHVTLSTGSSFNGPDSGRWVAPNALGHGRGRYRIGDYNGGGKADLGFFDPDNRSFYVGLSNGKNGFNFTGSGIWAHLGRCRTYAPFTVKGR